MTANNYPGRDFSHRSSRMIGDFAADRTLTAVCMFLSANDNHIGVSIPFEAN